MNWKKIEEQFFKWLSALVTYSIFLLLFFILYVIVKRGWHSVTWELISKEPEGGFYFGGGGGVLNAIAGSFYISTGASLMAVVIGLPLALAMNVNWKNKKWVLVLRFLLDSLWGIPSIVYGAFVFAIMTELHARPSLLAGIITITLLIFPIITRAMDEVLRNIPLGLLEATQSLGATKTEAALVFFRQAFPGFATAYLLALGRGIGDAASVLFTAGYTDHVPRSLSDPAATLPLSIFFQLSSPIEAVKEHAFGATLILTAIILFISIVSRIASHKLKRNVL